MELHTWLLYLIAAVGLSITPGPNNLLAITHGALYGHQLTLFTILGGALGFILLIALSMMGISALLQTSAQALVMLKEPVEKLLTALMARTWTVYFVGFFTHQWLWVSKIRLIAHSNSYHACMC